MSDFTRSIALVVGIDDYGNGIPPLRTARRDAERLAELLAQQHGYDVRLLVDAAATGERLLQLLTHELPAQLQQTDRLLFYFAGHGVALDGDGGANGYLLPHDAKRGQETTYLHMPRVHDALLALECRHLLVILDACFSGAFRWSSTRDLISLPPVIHQERYDRFLASPAWQVITSSAADQKALDQLFIGELGSRGDDGGDHSPFAQVLFAALEGKGDVIPVDGGDGVITATELYLYVEDKLQPATMQRGLQQTPRLWPLKKHDKGEFIFLVPGHALNLPPAPPLSFENNPYLGLRSYDDADSDLFFGRTEVIRELTAQVQQQPLTVVLGASGTGKSSVVKAGLLHRLRQDANTTVLPVQRPGTAPLQMLRRLATALSPDTTKPVADDVAAFQHAVRSWCAAHPAHRLVIVIDQLEELITQARDTAERDGLLRALADALDGCGDVLRVICTLRSDFEPQLAHGALAPRWTSARYVIRPMTQDELREVIEQPASRRVLYFEPSSLVDDLINEVIATPGGLPLLSFALSEMYQHYITRQSADRAITLADYRAVGGVIGALRTRAEAEFAALDPAHQATMRRVMLRMVAPGEGEAARRRVPRSELAYDDVAENTRVTTVSERLAAARLIVEDHEENGEPYIEPAHDALVNAWDRLLGWVREENRHALHDLRFQRRLGLAAREWALFADARRRDALLWRDPVRGSLLAQLRTEHDWLNQHERAFAQQSLKARRRTRMALTGTGLLIVALAIGASVAAVFANRSARRAADESAGARAALLGRTAMAFPTDEYTDSYGARLLLAAEAVRLAASTSEQRRVADAENVIRLLAPQYAGVGLTGYVDAFRRQEMPMLWHQFSPDGRWLLTGDYEAPEAYLWDLGTTTNDSTVARPTLRLVIDTVTLADDNGDLVAFREGKLVLLRQGQGGTQHRAVDLAAAEPAIQPWTGSTSSLPLDSVAAPWTFERVNDAPVLRHHATGQTVVLADAVDPYIVTRDLVAATLRDGVGVWRLAPGGAERIHLLPDAGEVVSWSADGHWLVTHLPPDAMEAAAEPLTGLPGRYAFWSLTDQPTLVWSEPAAGWDQPVSSPDGRYFLRAGVRTHRLIDTRELPRLQLLPVAAPRITAGAWSPDGRAFVTGHEDGSIVTWLASEQHVRRGPAVTTSYGHVHGIRASDDARWIVSLHPATHAVWRVHAGTIAFHGALNFDSIDAPSDPLVMGGRQDGDPVDPLRSYEFRGDSLFAPMTRGRTGVWLLSEVNGATAALPRAVATRAIVRTDTVSPDGRWRATGCAGFSPDGRWLFLEVDRFFPAASLQRRRNVETNLETSEQACVVRPASEPQAPAFLVHPDSALTPPDAADLIGATTRTTLSPNGRWALLEANTHGESSCGYNEGVRLIDLHAPDPLVTVFTIEGVGAGKCPIIHFSNDGRWLAADDRLYDLTAAVPAREPIVLPGFSLGFDPLSRMVAVHRGRPAGADPMSYEPAPAFLAFISLDPASLIRHACAAAGRNLTHAEWRSYFPREPYRAICPDLPVPRLRERIR